MTKRLRPWPLVRQGDRGQPVRDVQHMLQAHRHDLPVDGVFGQRTQEAVLGYQQECQLPVDGVVGPATWQAMVVQVGRGSQGTAVCAAQEELRRLGAVDDLLTVKVDGVFGPVTDAAVRVFQRRVSLAVTAFPVGGIIGPLTWQAMVGGTLTGAAERVSA